MKQRFLCSLFLILCTIFGGILRFHNLSPFKIYPDSYQNLLVAENIKSFQSVVGYLGTNGMIYPPFFMWTRPVYALLIDVFSFLNQTDVVAQYIALVAGILAIPISFFVVRKILKNSWYGLAAAGLLALSFNHTIWSGFIMTETISVLVMLLFLWSFAETVSRPVQFGNLPTLLTGSLFAVAIMTRYEYLIVIIPITLFVFLTSPTPKHYLSTFFAAMVFVSACFLVTLFPLDSLVPIILEQHKDLLTRAGIAIVFCMLGFWGYKNYKHQKLFSFGLNRLIMYVLIALAVLLNLQSFFGPIIPFYTDLSFIRSFVLHDFFISMFAFYGFLLLLNEKRHHVFAYTILLACTLLALTYQRVNPDMERYMTHLLPFLLLPASYGLVTAWRQTYVSKYVIALIILLIGAIQFQTSSTGLRYLNDPSWYTKAYEEKAAEHINAEIPDQVRNDRSNILLVSMPEPYFYEAGLSTHSINDNPPYIYIPDALDGKTVTIVQDMGMQDYFPTFNQFLNKNLQPYKKSKFKVNTPYHTMNQSLPETNPVTIYKIKLKDLKQIIKENSLP